MFLAKHKMTASTHIPSNATRILCALAFTLAALFATQNASAITRSVTNTSGDVYVSGSLHNALQAAQDGDVIDCSAIAGQTVTLIRDILVSSKKNLTING